MDGFPQADNERWELVRGKNAVLRRDLAKLQPLPEGPGGGAVSYVATKAVELSDKEREVFAFLLEVNEQFALNSTLRVAGGWVRDKVQVLVHNK